MAKVLRRRVVERLDPQEEDFSDVDGDLRNEFALVHEDPSRQYVWAHNSADDIGSFKGGIVPYRLERAEEGEKSLGVLMGGAEYAPGEVITKRGHVLMSCDKKLWEKRQRFERLKGQKAASAFIRSRQKTSTAGQHRAEWAQLGA